MIYLAIFVTISIITSLFALAACMLASQSNRRFEMMPDSESFDGFVLPAEHPAVTLRPSESVS